MEATLTIQCGIIALTKRKQHYLNSEYEHLQHFLQTEEDLGLHSANKQQRSDSTTPSSQIENIR